ncbi:MAG: helix-turn-helix domain-containing protein [Candidatus Gastranaerophilaceae bacterium]
MRDKRLKVLGDNIRAERMRKKLSQEALAGLIDVNKDSIRRIENGVQTPSAFIVFDIANALDISYEDLFKNVPKTKD